MKNSRARSIRNTPSSETSAYWKQWSEKCQPHGEWHEAVVRSLITLKGLTYAPTGGIVAAATTSLPEEIGGVRNWDYRYCWLRDATYTLYALMNAGYLDEARAWREWLLRAIAGSAAQMQIMYGVHGERRLNEFEIPWLAGYENSKPVRIGNAASNQFQLDVYGEVLAAMYVAHRAGIETSETEWQFQIELMKFLETKWRDPDEGIWEVRGGPEAIHAFENDGVAGVRSRGEAGGALRLRRGRTPRALARKSATKFTRRSASRVTTRRRKRSPRSMAGTNWTRAC